jgi:uncharacterized SAM-binding protein YcdF (DUF218 family)
MEAVAILVPLFVKLAKFISHRTRVVTVGMIGLLVLLGLAALRFPQQVLTVDSGPVRADAIVVLGGGMGERPVRAAELFSERAAPKIIVTGGGDTGDNVRLLGARGLPASAVEVEPRARSTKQNAQFTIPLLRRLGSERRAQGAEGPLRVIIVTSWYHSRRALHAFQHYAPDIQFYSRPSYFAFPRADWSPQGIRGYVRAEYVKLLGYWVCYGVCPF